MNTKELIAAIESALIGIDDTETGGNDGWWETSTGAAFGAFKLKEVIDLINEAMEGKVIVPVEPTDEMLSALMNGWIPIANSYMSENYKAMLEKACEQEYPKY